MFLLAIDNLKFTIPQYISSFIQAGRLQYTCKYTEDDLKKTLAQVLQR